MTLNDTENLNAIAIIGMAGRFPDAENISQFWNNLCRGKESVTFFDTKELDSSIPPDLVKQSSYIKARGVLKDAEKFDGAFFKISPREAEMMDPQQRIFLEVAWEALEDSGYNPDTYEGLIGVYAGQGENTYFINHLQSRRDLIEIFGVHQTSLLNLPDYLATRIAYKFNLKGPAVNVATGCSTSLVAVCQGVDSLISYQSDVVIAGGIFISCPQNRGYLYQEGGILSNDGHCRAFDKDARGTVFSNGAGVVILKRLSEAIEDGDHIYCSIQGTAMNNDGSQRVSFTAPGVAGQAQVIAMAQAAAGIDPGTISYVETHGTGTALGDPIEITALTQAFRAGTNKNEFCAIGSVKTNIGHLDAAAGIAGLIKTALCLKNATIPPCIHFTTPNPKLDLQNSPFYVNKNLIPWDTLENSTRRAGISSFGVGGTNAHIVLEEAPEPTPSGPSRPWQLFLFSGVTKNALNRLAVNLSDHLKQTPDLNIADVAYTLATGRKNFNCRSINILQLPSKEGLEELSFMPEEMIFASQKPVKRNVVFMFSGQGSQYANMGLELYQTESEFRFCVDHCAGILKQQLGFDLRKILYPSENQTAHADELLRQTNITQPALFVVEYALASLWLKWGVKPVAMVGHSIGEYVAACLSGVFSLEDALRLVSKRGQLIHALPGGSMMAVLGTEKFVNGLIGDDLCLSVINGPSLCVVSGREKSLDRLEKTLSEQNVHFRYLKTSHAFHSKMLDPLLDDFYNEVQKIPMHPPKIPFVSNVSGKWIDDNEATDPAYWVQHLRQTVRFSDCIGLLTKEENRVFMELGPGQTLSTLVRQHPGKMASHIILSSTRRPDERISDLAHILTNLGQLWMSGVEIDWNGFYADEKRQRLPLPPYPFESKRHWIETSGSTFNESVKPVVEISRHEAPVISNELIQQAAATLSNSDGKGNNIEIAVAKIWEEILGVSDVNRLDNFFDLGGSSIVALSLFMKIEKVFAKKLPLATLYEAPTVWQMSEILNDQEWSTPWSSLVPIQLNGNGTSAKLPIFFIHGAGGNILIYRDLAKHLGADQTVYGLQSIGLDGKQPYYTRIEDMASHYIREIKSVQPEGPYMLCGYCMGGSVALEMAQQLNENGDKTSLLALLETYNFSKIGPQNWLDNLHIFNQKIVFHWKNFLLLNNRGKIKFVYEKAKVARNRSKVWSAMLKTKLQSIFNTGNGNGINSKTILYEIWESNDLASLNYAPKPYAGKITQFLPIKEYAHHIGLEPGWEKLAEEGVETHILPTYPAGMLVEPFAKNLADSLKECINNASN